MAMTSLQNFSILAMLAAISFAVPNPAVNRIDVPVHKPHSTTTISSETGLSSSPKPYLTLNPRDPAVNRIDAPVHRPHFSPMSSSAIASSSSKTIHALVKERDPAVNRIDAVGDDVADQALFSVAGGTPVTLATSDIQQLETAATDIQSAAAAIPMPAISVNASPDETAVPASFFAGPASSSSGAATPFEVPGTQTVIHITLRPDRRPIAKFDMGQALVHAMSDLREAINQNGEHGWLPVDDDDDWSWFDRRWACLLTAERNLIPGPGGRPQRLTYGTLRSALVGLWGAMYAKGNYVACDFAISDGQWGIVGSGSMSFWNSSAGDLTAAA